jgi:hypothetical protein
MTVVAIVALVASFALPALRDSRKSANEAAAIGMVRSLFHAQESYRQKRLPTTSPGGYASTLVELDAHGLLPAELTRGEGDESAKGFHRGYRFYSGGGTSNPRAGSPAMFVIAYPESSATGDRAFLMTEDGRIFYRQGGTYFLNPEEGFPLSGG